MQCAMVLTVAMLATASSLLSQQTATPQVSGKTQVCAPAALASPYIPVDSWVYPAVLRLYSIGYVNTVYLGMRPWTRASVRHMLAEAAPNIAAVEQGEGTDEAQGIYDALLRELRFDDQGACPASRANARVESTYSVMRAISGTPLRDSFHLGSTIINDYGRPYQNGFNNYTGASGYATAGRFTLYVRGEFHEAPSATGYSQALAQEMAAIDDMTEANPQKGQPAYTPANILDGLTTIPVGQIASTTNGRFLEAYVSAHYFGHEISFGKQDEWLGPAQGASMAYSNNAENIYTFRINRVEPLRVPFLSRVTGPFRYDFLVGSLRGHSYMPNPAYQKHPVGYIANVINPGDPWIHVEKLSFRPTQNLEFGFERSAIWGGKGHAPITIKSFLRSFFSTVSPLCTGSGANVSCPKDGTKDPGARFSSFDFSYRVPGLRNWLTLYTDGEVHDDISPVDAPRRASWRPGLYLAHVPGLPKLDLRAEAVTTDPPIKTSQGGRFMYWEYMQKQGYTNQGQMLGDWIGREAKGGQGWITYHLSGDEWLQVSARNQKAAKDFIPGGTTLNDIDFQAVKRLGHQFEINGQFAFEHWKAPVYPTGVATYPADQHTVTTTTIQLTWYPERKVSF